MQVHIHNISGFDYNIVCWFIHLRINIILYHVVVFFLFFVVVVAKNQCDESIFLNSMLLNGIQNKSINNIEFSMNDEL